MRSVTPFKTIETMNAAKGGVVAIVSSFLIAVLFASLFRLPIPFGGYIGPFGEVSPYDLGITGLVKLVTGAWVFYGGFLGGYIVLFVLGAASGAWIGRKCSNSNRKNRLIFIGSIVVSTVCVFALSILDYLIGPW